MTPAEEGLVLTPFVPLTSQELATAEENSVSKMDGSDNDFFQLHLGYRI